MGYPASNKSKQKPTNGELIRGYENLLHEISCARILGDHDAIVNILDSVSEWSRAHDDHHGSLGPREVQKNIYRVFWKRFFKH
jgi:hypothetical protein